MSKLYNLIDKELTLTFLPPKTGEWEKQWYCLHQV